MNIGYCTYTDPYNKKSWSGTHYFMLKTLEEYCGKVTPLGPLKNRYIFLGRVINKITMMLFDKRFLFRHSPFVTGSFARMLKKKIKKNKVTVLFVPAGGILFSRLDIDLPIVAAFDATITGLVDYNDGYSNLLPISRKWAIKTDIAAVKKSSRIIYSSKWAAESAIKEYGCDKDKIDVITFGANLDKIPSREETLSRRKQTNSTCKLLFVGVDWVYKGGQIAFDIMVELNTRGIDTELILCGCIPPNGIRHKKLKIIGFLDKNDTKQSLELSKYYLEASFFLLPTRNECSAIVLCEAASYALPRIATYTGGVPSYIENAKDGYLLPLDANCFEYADVIADVWNDKDKYYGLCENSRDRYEKELNWSVWGKKVAEIMKETTLLGDKREK